LNQPKKKQMSYANNWVRTREGLTALSRKPKFDLSECRTLSLEEAMDATVLRQLTRQKQLREAEDVSRESSALKTGAPARKKWPMK